MSLVGPRPEVLKHKYMYSGKYECGNERGILAKSSNPEKTYIQKILPDKEVNLRYKHHISCYLSSCILNKCNQISLIRLFH